MPGLFSCVNDGLYVVLRSNVKRTSLWNFSEAAARGVMQEKPFLNILQSPLENTSVVGVFFKIKHTNTGAFLLNLRRTASDFWWKFAKIFRIAISSERFWTATILSEAYFSGTYEPIKSTLNTTEYNLEFQVSVLNRQKRAILWSFTQKCLKIT